MPKKSAGRASRARAQRHSRPAPRPGAVLPFERTASAAPPIGTPGVTGSVVGAAIPARPAVRTVRPARVGSLIPITDYRYVMADLRRIGVLAAAAFVILIGLTFVIH